MFITFEAEFGEIKISRIRATYFGTSPTEENEIFVRLPDLSDLLDRTEIPKGKCTVTRLVKAPASCPHCHQELPHGFALKDFESFIYNGVTVKGVEKIADYDAYQSFVELRLRYETIQYKNHITNQIMVLNVTQELRTSAND